MKRSLRVLIVVAFSASHSSAQDVNDSLLKPAHTLSGHTNSIIAIAISPDGRTLASSSHDKTVRLWDLEKAQARGKIGELAETVPALCFSPDGVLLAAACRDRTIRIWDVATGEEKVEINDVSEKKLLRCVLQFSPDGTILASATNDRLIRLWDVRTGNEKITIDTGHRTRVQEFLFTPDGQTLISNGYHDLKLWGLDGHEIGTVKGELRTMRLSDDGKLLLSAIGHQVTQTTVDTGEALKFIVGKEYLPSDRFSARLSPDGKTLATIDRELIVVDLGRALVPAGKQRCRLVLMDVESGEERTIIEKRGSANWFGPIWYSPNGKTLVLWCWKQKTLTFVDATTGEERARLTKPDDEEFGMGTVPPITFTPDGKYFVVAHGPSISVWVVP